MDIFNFKVATTEQEIQWNKSVKVFIEKIETVFSEIGTTHDDRILDLDEAGVRYDIIFLRPVKEKNECLMAEIHIRQDGMVYVKDFRMNTKGTADTFYQRTGEKTISEKLPSIFESYERMRTGTQFFDEILPAIKELYNSY